MASEQYGYDEEFVDTPPEYLKCIICHLVLREPLQLIECGHHYCAACFKRIQGYSSHFNSRLSCPIDRQVIDLAKVTKDKFVERLVLDLQVKCSFNNNGCTWVGELRNIEAHRNECFLAMKEESLKQHQCSGSEVGTTSTDVLLNQIFGRLEKCEESLVEKEKYFAYVRYQLKETKENVQKRDEEIEVLKNDNEELKRKIKQFENVSASRKEVELLKQKMLNNEEVQKCQAIDIEALKDENEELQRKMLQFVNENESTSCKEKTNVEFKMEELVGLMEKELKTKSDEAQKNAIQSDKSDVNNEKGGGARAVVKPTLSLTTTQPVATNNKPNIFVWKSDVKEWKVNQYTYSPPFVCHTGGLRCSLRVILSSSKQILVYFLPTDVSHQEEVRYNVDVELIKDDVKNTRMKACSKEFVYRKGDYTWQLGMKPRERDYEAFIVNNILNISCTWTCEHKFSTEG